MDSKQAIDDALIDAFCGITSSTKDQAFFFLESHNGDLNAAVSTFFDSDGAAAAAAAVPRRSPSYSPSDSKSASLSPSRSRSPSPSPQSRAPYSLRSRKQSGSASSSKKTASGRSRGVVHTFSDLNRSLKESSGSDSDEPNEYYTGGEKSGMLVQGPPKSNDVESIFNQAREFGGMRDPADFHRSSSSSRSFSGTGRTLAGDTVSSAPQPPEVVNHTIIFWTNGFTVDDGPLRGLDDPENAPFLESIRKSECPKELEPADRRTQVNCELGRREENYIEPVKHQKPFKGVGRTLGSSSNTEQEAPQPGVAVPSFNTAPLPSRGLVVDGTLPTTSIQLRLVDGTRMVSQFNSHHTIRDIRAFIDASRPGGARNYQLQAMGFPPKLLADEDQTIEQAGLASSVVIQKF